MATQTIPDAQTRRAVELFLERIAGRYAIDQVWLYGSRARGDAGSDSDADVAIILEGPVRRTVDVAMEMSNETFDVLMETGVLVSPMPIYRGVWDDPAQHSNPYLLANIKREGVVL